MDLYNCDDSAQSRCACVEYERNPELLPQSVSPWISGDEFNELQPFTRKDYVLNGTVSFLLFWLNFVIIFGVAICVFHVKKVPRDHQVAHTEHVDEVCWLGVH